MSTKAMTERSNHVLLTCTPWINKNERLLDCRADHLEWERKYVVTKTTCLKTPTAPGKRNKLHHHDCWTLSECQCLTLFLRVCITHTSYTRACLYVCAFSAFGAGGTSRSSEKRGVVVLTPNNVTIVAPCCRHSRRQPQCLQERLRDCLNGTMNGPLSAGLMSEEQPWRHSHTLVHKDTHTVVTSTHPRDTFGRVEARLKHYGCVSYRLH